MYYTLLHSSRPHTSGSQQSIINNGITNIQMGSPFKPPMMTQGSMLANMRKIYKDDIKDNPTKRLASQESSQHIYFKKLKAMGKSVHNTSSTVTELSYKSVNPNLPSQHLRKCRSGGSVVPKKVGAIR